jgi:ribose transport system permease protein
MTAEKTQLGAAAVARRVLGRVVSSELSGVGLPIAIIVVALTISAPGFLTPFNINSVLATVAIITVLGLAQLMALAIGQFNLAVAAQGALSAMFMGYLMQTLGVPWPAAIVGALLMGALLGAIQGGLIVGLRLNPFLVTLGLASFFSGVMFVSTRGKPFDRFPDQFNEIGFQSVAGIPVLMFISVAIVIVMVVLLQQTLFGRQLLATGASLRVAFFSAVPTDRMVLTAHALSGALAAFAGFLVVARLATAQTAIGEDWLLPSFAAPVLGGTLLTGGKASATGTLLGALLLTLIANALNLLGVSQYWYQAGLGVVILVGVMLDRLRMVYVAQRAPE